MSAERFEWLRNLAGEVIATPGCESNVKEIFDKCWELKATRKDIKIFNQFEEFGNYLWHFEVTGNAIEEVFKKNFNSKGNPVGFISATGSGGIRYLGVGAMLVGGIWALIAMRRSLWSGVRSGLQATRAAADAAYDHTEHDIPMRLVLIGIALFVIPILVAYEGIVGSFGVAAAMTITMLLAGFLFSSVAGYMAGLVGSSNNPISGITIATILLTSLLLLAIGGEEAVGPAGAIMVGAVVCCAAAIGGDNLQDLKAGYLLGATPWRQQLAQCLGVVAAVLVIAPILNLLLTAYGIGAPTDDHPNSLLAPQATLMASVANGVFGGGLPWDMIAWGAVIGIVVIGVDLYLARTGAAWRAPVLAVAVGIYLPLELEVPILLGGLIAEVTSRRAAVKGGRQGLLFAAGLITGEALVGILMAIPIVLSRDANVFALPFDAPSFLGLLAVGAVCVALYRVAARDGEDWNR